MMSIAGFEIVSVQTGTFRLDGGAMFGVVPKVLWAPREDVDAHNRILLATRTLIAVSRDRECVMLVDTGTGTKWADDEADRFEIRHDGSAIAAWLETGFGLAPADVTDIVVTHLHFDHNGGLSEWVGEPGGQTRLCFPQARHWVHRRHWEHVQRPTEKDRASFLSRDYEHLERSGVLRFVEGDAPESPWKGVRWFVSDGHTPGQLLPIFEEGDGGVMFTGDVFPTSSHLRVPWVMAYDNEPLKTIAEKHRILGWCREGRLQLAFPHDHRVGGAVLDFANDRALIAQPADL